ncbi:hypothetical protein VULLAG_LOCUS6933 [Vulpes lagopus]
MPVRPSSPPLPNRAAPAPRGFPVPPPNSPFSSLLGRILLTIPPLQEPSPAGLPGPLPTASGCVPARACRESHGTRAPVPGLPRGAANAPRSGSPGGSRNGSGPRRRGSGAAPSGRARRRTASSPQPRPGPPAPLRVPRGPAEPLPARSPRGRRRLVAEAGAPGAAAPGEGPPAPGLAGLAAPAAEERAPGPRPPARPAVSGLSGRPRPPGLALTSRAPHGAAPTPRAGGRRCRPARARGLPQPHARPGARRPRGSPSHARSHARTHARAGPERRGRDPRRPPSGRPRAASSPPPRRRLAFPPRGPQAARSCEVEKKPREVLQSQKGAPLAQSHLKTVAHSGRLAAGLRTAWLQHHHVGSWKNSSGSTQVLNSQVEFYSSIHERDRERMAAGEAVSMQGA